MSQELLKGRFSAKQLERKFDGPVPESKPVVLPERTIPSQAILPKNPKTIYFPKQSQVTRALHQAALPPKPPQRSISHQSLLAQSAAPISYHDIRPSPPEKSVLDRIASLFVSVSEPCRCPASNLPSTCLLAKEWLGSANHAAIREKFADHLRRSGDAKILKQIALDVERTHPLKAHPHKLAALKQVLRAYAAAEPRIGYMQGMNFVAAALVYHADDYIAYELFARLVDQLPLKDLYLPMYRRSIVGLPASRNTCS